MSSVVLTLMVILIGAAAFFYILGPLQGHDTWIDHTCQNARDFYHFDFCNYPEWTATAAGCATLVYILLKWYGRR